MYYADYKRLNAKTRRCETREHHRVTEREKGFFSDASLVLHRGIYIKNATLGLLRMLVSIGDSCFSDEMTAISIPLLN